MSTPIISAETASNLNSKVMEKIDPRLYLFCNYEPTVRHVISEDAKYQISIQDLYKFSFDSGCIIKNYSKYLKKGQIAEKEFFGFREILDCISMLRTIFDHNTSEQNGRIEKERLEQYSIWIKSLLNKPNPEDINDYVILNKKLSDLASQLVDYIDRFIDRVSHNQRKSDIIQMWKAETLHWYCSNAKTDIYLGQLQDVYIANTIANGRDYSELYENSYIKRKVFRWIEAALYYPIENELLQLQQEIETYKKMLNGESAMYEAMKKRMTPEEIENKGQCVKSLLEERQKRFGKLKSERNDLEENARNYKRGNYYVYRFFEHLETQLNTTVTRLDAEGIDYTYLPQDLIQEDILAYFEGVRSPEKDF